MKDRLINHRKTKQLALNEQPEANHGQPESAMVASGPAMDNRGWLWPIMANHDWPWEAMGDYGWSWLVMAGHGQPGPAMAGHI